MKTIVLLFGLWGEGRRGELGVGGLRRGRGNWVLICRVVLNAVQIPEEKKYCTSSFIG